MKIEKERGEAKKSENNIKKFWNWLWHSDSWLSYIVFLAIIFLFIKFVFLPSLGLIFGTSLPLAIVESSSMDHHALKSGNNYEICGKSFEKSKFLNFDEYWNSCGNWYEKNKNITKNQFEDFKFKNGFRKGDIMIILGKKPEKIQIGDVLIFNAGRNYPIIHRIVSILNNIIQTKGDHNSGQLTPSSDIYRTDETNIQQSQIIGVAVARIPYVGWLKIFAVENTLYSVLIIVLIIIIYLYFSNRKK
jgi:signal peptidase I